MGSAVSVREQPPLRVTDAPPSSNGAGREVATLGAVHRQRRAIDDAAGGLPDDQPLGLQPPGRWPEGAWKGAAGRGPGRERRGGRRRDNPSAPSCCPFGPPGGG